MGKKSLKINYDNVEVKLQEIENNPQKQLSDDGNSYVKFVKKIDDEEGAFKGQLENMLNKDKELFENFSNLSNRINAGIRNVCSSFKELDSSMANDLKKK